MKREVSCFWDLGKQYNAVLLLECTGVIAGLHFIKNNICFGNRTILIGAPVADMY